MAKKRNNQGKDTNDLSKETIRHLSALDFSSATDYYLWCRQNGFSANTNKSSAQRYKEICFYNDQLALRRLKSHKKECNLRNQIINIYRNNFKKNAINNDSLIEICRGFRKFKKPKILLDTLLYLESNSALLKNIRHIKGSIALTEHYGKWVRHITQWKPRTHNVDKQFSSLSRHLLANYDVPAFMDDVWYQDDSKPQTWFVHMGSGKNIRTAVELPISLTKKMAHYFLCVPDGYSIGSAFRWAQVHALGGDRSLVEAIRETRLVREFVDDEFWLSVLQFFIDNPLLDKNYVNPIVDYIWNQKYENRLVFVDRGVAQELGPAQPNFNMKGRTPESLLRQVNDWHRQLGKESKIGKLQWVKSSIADFQLIEGSAKKENMRIWRIRELLNSEELLAEGRALRHCVATYARSCHGGRSSIWTMDVEEKTGLTKLLTIEVYTRSKAICQVRGRRNRLPADKEKDIVRRWAQKEDLNIASYI